MSVLKLWYRWGCIFSILRGAWEEKKKHIHKFINVGLNFFVLDSRRVLVGTPGTDSKKNISSPDAAPF